MGNYVLLPDCVILQATQYNLLQGEWVTYLE